MDKTRIENYIKKAETELHKRSLNDGDYCVIIYKTKPYSYGGTQFKTTAFIYKNLLLFSEKAQKDIDSISGEFGITFEVWSFD